MKAIKRSAEDWVEFIVGTILLGSFAIAISGFVLALGWLSVSEILQWK